MRQEIIFVPASFSHPYKPRSVKAVHPSIVSGIATKTKVSALIAGVATNQQLRSGVLIRTGPTYFVMICTHSVLVKSTLCILPVTLADLQIDLLKNRIPSYMN